MSLLPNRKTVAALVLSASALVSLVISEHYTTTAVVPVPGDAWTVGFGTTTRPDGSPVKPGDTTTPPQALARALVDIQKYEGALKSCVDAELTQNEYDAYMQLSYNIGSGAFCASSIPAKLSAGNYEAACRTILEFDGFRDRTKPKVWNAKKKKWEYPLIKLRGLTLRREREYRLCITP
jgi:lysozyme